MQYKNFRGRLLSFEPARAIRIIAKRDKVTLKQATRNYKELRKEYMNERGFL